MANKNLLFDESKSVDLGTSYLHQKNYELAIREFNKVLEVNPKNETALVKLGHVYLQQKKFSQALVQFNKALELNPQSIDPHEGLGFCYFEQGRIEEAMDKFNYVLKFTLNNEHTHFGLGLCYQQKKKLDKSIEEFSQVLKINPRHQQARYHLGLCYHQQKDFSQALAQFNKALELNPQDWHCREGLAQVYLEQDKLDLCLKELQQIKGSSLESEPYHHIMAQINIRQKNYDLAIEELQKTLKINPRSEFAYENLMRIYFRQKNYDSAKEYADKLLRINPSNVYLYQELGNIYFEKKDYPQALAQFNKALELNPQSIDPHEGLGFCYFEQGRIEEAMDKFNYVLKTNPNSEHAHFGLGLCFYQNKEFDKAIGEFNRVLKINPRHPQARYHLGLCYHQQKDFSQALVQFSQAIKLNPQDGHAHYSLGCIFLQRKQYDLAQEAFNKAIEINAENESAHQGLGSVYLEQGLYSFAEAEFRKTLQFDPDNIFAHQMMGYIYKRQGKYDLAVAEFIKATNLCLSKENADKQLKNFGKKKVVSLVNSKRREFVIKMLRMPSFCNKDEIKSTELNSSLLPPLALGQITAYLKANGIRIDQDDLNIKIHYDNYYSKMTDKEIDLSVFFDEDKIFRYLSGAQDKDLESIMEKIETKTKFRGYNIFLLSLPFVFSNSSGLMFTLTLSHFLKNKYNPILILGGPCPAINLLIKYNCKDIDFIISDDGEIILLNLLSSLKNDLDLAEFLSSQTKEDGKIIATEVYPPLKPDFSDLPIDKYRYVGLNSNYGNGAREILEEFNSSGTLLLPFKFIRGCPYECIFCSSSTDKSMYVLEPSRVALHLKELQEEYNPTGFFFLSDTINISRQYIKELCDEIIENKVKILWSDCARADNLDKDTLCRMREAGCIRLIFGLESGSTRMLRYTDKRISLGGLENILKWSDEADIWTGVEIICGLPHEKDEDIEETIAFLNRNKEYINTVYFNQFDLRESSILLHSAKKYRIENIIEINQYPNPIEGFNYFHKYGYDEINGLQWQDKKRQILFSYKKLHDSIYWNNSFPAYEFEHFLFFLYNKFSDKRRVYDMFTKAALEKNNLLQKYY